MDILNNKINYIKSDNKKEIINNIIKDYKTYTIKLCDLKNELYDIDIESDDYNIVDDIDMMDSILNYIDDAKPYDIIIINDYNELIKKSKLNKEEIELKLHNYAKYEESHIVIFN